MSQSASSLRMSAYARDALSPTQWKHDNVGIDAEGGGDTGLKRPGAQLAKVRRLEENLQGLATEEGIDDEDLRQYGSSIEAERSRLSYTVDASRQRQHLARAEKSRRDELRAGSHQLDRIEPFTQINYNHTVAMWGDDG